MWALNVVEYLNIKPKFVESTNIGGSSFIAHLQPILHALASGQCNAVLVCYGSTQRTQTIGRREKLKAKQLIDPYPYESPYQPLVPITPYALMAARHMHQFGTTRRHLAEVAVAARRWAQLNPEAFRRDPLDIDEVLAAKMIADPFWYMIAAWSPTVPEPSSSPAMILQRIFLKRPCMCYPMPRLSGIDKCLPWRISRLLLQLSLAREHSRRRD